MRFSKYLGIPAACAAALWAGGATAFLETGTLLTNSASATYRAGTEGTSLSYSATAKIYIANPAMFLWKKVYPTSVGLGGGFVTFTISFSNAGANSAFNVTIYDKLPTGGGSMKLSSCSATGYSAYVVGGTAPVLEYTSDGTNFFPACNPTALPAQDSWIFRWKIPSVGIMSSGEIKMVMEVYPP